jgi:hypothetical protein
LATIADLAQVLLQRVHDGIRAALDLIGGACSRLRAQQRWRARFERMGKSKRESNKA